MVGCGGFLFARPLPSTSSAAGCPVLFGSFIGTMGLSDFSCPYIIGVRPWTSRCAQRYLYRWGTGDLPVLVRGASVHAQGLRPRGTPERLASNDALSVAFRPSDSVGVPNNPAFAAQYPAYTYPCQRLTSCLTTDRP